MYFSCGLLLHPSLTPLWSNYSVSGNPTLHGSPKPCATSSSTATRCTTPTCTSWVIQEWSVRDDRFHFLLIISPRWWLCTRLSRVYKPHVERVPIFGICLVELIKSWRQWYCIEWSSFGVFYMTLGHRHNFCFSLYTFMYSY